jgi:hypothetical protein
LITLKGDDPLKPFLLEIAEEIYKLHHRSLDATTIVFPNRRAALYFRKHITSLLDRPAFSPRLLTIEEFIGGFSNFKVPEKIKLVHILQQVYDNVLGRTNDSSYSSEPFDQFFFWGEMLLRDFDEADKYLVTADLLFRDLSHQREIDTSFDFLTDEQRDFLRSFWANFDENDSVNKRKFLWIWRQLPSVYAVFKDTLKQQGLAYEGMVHRDVAENIRERARQPHHFPVDDKSKLYFIGFNALTKAEETILSHFVREGMASMKWDIDDYYFNNQRQEAGKFFRDYREHRVFGKTFPVDVPSNLKSPKEVGLYGAAQPVGQAKLMAQVLKGLLDEGANPEDCLIVLADEKLLMPVLHGVSGHVEKLNVTMGFPLSATPLFNFVELLVELQVSAKDECFNHRPALTLLGHPYVLAADPAVAQAKRKEILKKNWVSIPRSFLSSQVDVHNKIFVTVPLHDRATGIISYLKGAIQEIATLRSLGEFDKEYCYHVIKLLNKMDDVFELNNDQDVVPTKVPETSSQRKEKLRSFLRLFRQLLKGEKIPFAGEPLRGLQVMGVLETRNLDFKNVFILSLNEGSLPSFNTKGSYIPHNIRKAYGLPTVDQQDAIYAYLFYRSFQRAENVYLFYNSETDDLGLGEMSRYLQQLIFESGIPLQRRTLHNDFQPMQVEPISIRKDDRVFSELAKFCAGAKESRTLSPSAINQYLECRLKFYFKYVARIREADEVEEELDARVLGTLFHQIMELFYKKIIDTKNSNVIESSDFENYEPRINKLIDEAFIRHYQLDATRNVVYEGQRLVVREIVKRFVDRILMMDKAYTPFVMEALEKDDLAYSIRVEGHGNPIVVLGGSIDRADRKGDVIRVVDYKTGKDALDFVDVASLFHPGRDRNKAAFQTFLYTLLYKKNVLRYTQARLIPGLMNRVNLFHDDFQFGLKQGNSYIEDASGMLVEFEDRLKDLLAEIFDPFVPFDQTDDEDVCKFCPYRQVCHR